MKDNTKNSLNDGWLGLAVVFGVPLLMAVAWVGWDLLTLRSKQSCAIWDFFYRN